MRLRDILVHSFVHSFSLSSRRYTLNSGAFPHHWSLYCRVYCRYYQHTSGPEQMTTNRARFTRAQRTFFFLLLFILLLLLGRLLEVRLPRVELKKITCSGRSYNSHKSVVFVLAAVQHVPIHTSQSVARFGMCLSVLLLVKGPYFMGLLIVNTIINIDFLSLRSSFCYSNILSVKHSLCLWPNDKKNRTMPHITVNHTVWRKSSYLNCHFRLSYRIHSHFTSFHTLAQRKCFSFHCVFGNLVK